jgi:large subunit ribosomal protein L25
MKEPMAEDTFTLELVARSVTGKQVKRLRASGEVPAVIHDHGKESINVQAPYLELYRLYVRAGRHHPVQLIAGTRKFTALIKSASFEPRNNQLTHVVFNAVDRNQKVEAAIPVHPQYEAGMDSTPAERASLIVLQQLDEVEIRAIPGKLPDVLHYDAAKLAQVGDHVSVADLIVPDGVEVITEASHVLATVFEPGALAAANDAVGGTVEPAEAVTSVVADAPTTDTVKTA